MKERFIVFMNEIDIPTVNDIEILEMDSQEMEDKYTKAEGVSGTDQLVCITIKDLLRLHNEAVRQIETIELTAVKTLVDHTDQSKGYQLLSDDEVKSLFKLGEEFTDYDVYMGFGAKQYTIKDIKGKFVINNKKK